MRNPIDDLFKTYREEPLRAHRADVFGQLDEIERSLQEYLDFLIGRLAWRV